MDTKPYFLERRRTSRTPPPPRHRRHLFAATAASPPPLRRHRLHALLHLSDTLLVAATANTPSSSSLLPPPPICLFLLISTMQSSPQAHLQLHLSLQYFSWGKGLVKAGYLFELGYSRLRNKLDLKCKLKLEHKGLTELSVTVSQIHPTELAS